MLRDAKECRRAAIPNASHAAESVRWAPLQQLSFLSQFQADGEGALLCLNAIIVNEFLRIDRGN